MAKRTKFMGYATYNFVEKDPIIDQLRTILADEKMSYRDVHEKTNVSIGTLRGWFDGATRRPQHATIMAVARSAGWDYRLVKVEGGKVVELKKKVA